jgi:predicted RND superfamily exporter protein
VPEIGRVVSYVDLLREVHRAFADDATDLPARRNLVAQYLFLYGMARGPDDLTTLIDAPHQRAVVTAFSRSDEARFSAQLTADLHAWAGRRFANLPARVHLLGGSIGAQQAMNDVVVEEKLRNLAQVGGVVVALSSAVFGSLAAGFLVAAPLALAVAINLGLMGWTGTWLSMGTAAITAMGVSIGADFAIYLLYRVREERRAGRPPADAVEAALATAGHAVCFVSAAVVAGYLTLAFAGFRPWVQVGGLTALMISTSALGTLTVLPALVLRLRPAFLGTRPAPVERVVPALVGEEARDG